MNKVNKRKNKTICKRKGITDEVIRIRRLITKLKKTARNKKNSYSTTRRTKAT